MADNREIDHLGTIAAGMGSDLVGRILMFSTAIVCAGAYLVTSRERHGNGNTAGQEIRQTTFHYFLILNFLSNG